MAGSLFSGKGSLLSKGSPFRKGALLSPGSVLVRKIQLFSLDPTFGLRKHSLYPTFSTFSTSEEPWPHRQHTQIKQIGTRGSPQRGGVSGPVRLEEVSLVVEGWRCLFNFFYILYLFILIFKCVFQAFCVDP